MQRPKPTWEAPQAKSAKGSLTLFNSLTQTKNEFVPQSGNLVKWYICGPTVYDAAHMGHARAYITFDILRRVMEDYFGYDVLYQMNVTDIDDKIITRGRQQHLFESYKKAVTAVGEKELAEYVRLWENFVSKLRGTDSEAEPNRLWEKLQKMTPKEIEARVKNDEKFKMNLDTAASMKGALDALKAKKGPSQEDIDSFLDASKDIISAWLDQKDGAKVQDHKIFRDLSSFWERSFFSDMDKLAVLPPDVITRVSDFVPAIVDFTKRIIDNGFAYEAEGSVYFDAMKFDEHEKHYYAKLKPSSAFNTQLIEEGEGSISTNLGGKRSPSDFALWKKSKPGEPIWNSPWSEGRPGWHIECSVMASHILGEKMDIHSGGIDLAFPHHDNEIAQSEAHFGCTQWVNYFLHAGHLHINGLKMSKSLKNFITIEEALKKYTSRQIRIMFLLHTWYQVLDFKDDTINQAIAVETTFKNFFSTVRAFVRAETDAVGVTTSDAFGPQESALLSELFQVQERVHAALCDSIDTPKVMDELKALVSAANVYINSQKSPSIFVLVKIAKFVTKILKVFGVVESRSDFGFSAGPADSAGANFEEQVLPYLKTMAQFRDSVRSVVRDKKDVKEILALCDALRDTILPELGVRLEDREGESSLVKLEDKETLLKEKREKEEREADKRRKKEEQAQKEAQKRQEKLAKGKVSPQDMFRSDPSYSKFDEQGIPTHDSEGAEVSKSKRKKLEKEHQQQQKLHEEYLASVGSSSSTA